MEVSARAKELRLLITKYAKGQLTIEEKEKLDEFMNRSPENASLVELLISADGPARLLERQARLEKVWEGHSFQTILHRYKRRRRRPQLPSSVIIITALLLMVGAGYFLVYLLLGE